MASGHLPLVFSLGQEKKKEGEEREGKESEVEEKRRGEPGETAGLSLTGRKVGQGALRLLRQFREGETQVSGETVKGKTDTFDVYV